MVWNESISLYCSFSTHSRWYQSYCIHSLNDLTNKRKEVPKGKKVSVIERSCDAECSRNQLLRNGLHCLSMYDIIAKRNINKNY